MMSWFDKLLGRGKKDESESMGAGSMPDEGMHQEMPSAGGEADDASDGGGEGEGGSQS